MKSLASNLHPSELFILSKGASIFESHGFAFLDSQVNSESEKYSRGRE